MTKTVAIEQDPFLRLLQYICVLKAPITPSKKERILRKIERSAR